MKRIDSVLFRVVGLCLAFLLAGCGREAGLSSENDDGLRLELDFSTLYRNEASGAQTCVSIAARVDLAVDGRAIDSAPLAPEQAQIVFNALSVNEGDLVEVEVYSNIGILLYAASEAVSANDLSAGRLTITVAAEAPVLQVCLDVVVMQLDAQGIYRGTFIVSNLGAGDMAWEIQGAQEVTFRPNATTTRNGAPQTVTATSAFLPAPVTATVTTAQGAVQVEIQTPPLVIEANDDEATTEEDRPFAIDVLVNDVAPDPSILTLAVEVPPTNGIAEPSGTMISYAPAPDFSGSDRFIYTLRHPNGQTDTATVIVTVNPCIDFEALDQGTLFTANNTQPGAVIFTENGFPVRMESYISGNNEFFGQIAVQGDANNTILSMNNASLEVAPGAAGVRFFRFQFIDLGGTVNLVVNDETPLEAKDFSEITNALLPAGITIEAPPAAAGTVTLRADNSTTIMSLRVGGQELLLDNLCFGANEPQ